MAARRPGEPDWLSCPHHLGFLCAICWTDADRGRPLPPTDTPTFREIQREADIEDLTLARNFRRRNPGADE